MVAASKLNGMRQLNDPDVEKYQGRFAARLRELRASKGIETKELAKRMNVTLKTAYSWEAGRSSPSFDYLPKLAAALGCSIRSLFPTE
jgi:transcriptional regulator with XRE-family HTH domain